MSIRGARAIDDESSDEDHTTTIRRLLKQIPQRDVLKSDDESSGEQMSEAENKASVKSTKGDDLGAKCNSDNFQVCRKKL